MTDPVAPPAIDTLPPAPIRGQAGFSAATGTFLEALPDWGDQLEAAGEAAHTNAVSAQESAEALNAAAAAAVSASRYMARSSSSLTMDAGAKTVHLDGVDPALPPLFALDDLVALIYGPDPTMRLVGSVTATDGLDDLTVTVAADGVVGAGGPFANWIVVSAAFLSAGATAAELWEGTSDQAPMTPATVYDALAEVTLTDAATIAVDMGTLINGVVTLGGNRTLGNPTNAKPGQTGRIRAIQDGTGSWTLSYGNKWKRQGGAIALVTTAGHYGVLEYDVQENGDVVYELINDPIS